MEIVAKHVKVLRDALHGVRNEQVSRKTKEQRIKEIKRNIREIEMIAFSEKERCWIYDAMHKKIFWKDFIS